jgi:cyclopropane fatty-acyl-phospholipid synthase-like methyltransferase
MDKRFCQATENNKDAILDALKTYFEESTLVFEIGSGTGQHAIHFAPQLRHLIWMTADMVVNHDTIKAWVADFPSDNIQGPLNYEVGVNEWPTSDVDAVFSANTAHIMQPEVTRLMMTSVAENLPSGGVFCLYGPFNINGKYTSEGNESFDAHLAREGCGGIRDISELRSWVADKGLILEERVTMPANNFLLVWRKK